MVDLRPEGANDTKLRNNCGLVALATALGHDYNDVVRMVRARKRVRSNWTGRTTITDLKRHLDNTDARYFAMSHRALCVRKTVEHLNPRKRYILRIGGHFMACIMGNLVDQSGTFKPDDPRYARKFVSHIYEVIPDED